MGTLFDYSDSDLVLNTEQRSVIRDGMTIALSYHEYRFLRYLSFCPFKPASKADISEYVWQGGIVSASDLYRCVHRVRNLIEKTPWNPRLIITIRGFGYVLTQSIHIYTEYAELALGSKGRI